MLSLNRPSSPLTSHTHSPQSSRPASPTLQTQDENSQHSTEPSTHAPAINAVKQVNLGLARTTSASASSGRGKRGSGISGRKSTSLRRKEVKSQDGDIVAAAAAAPVKVDQSKKPVPVEPEVVKAVDVASVEPSVKEDPIVVETSTSVPQEEREKLAPSSQPALPKATNTLIKNVTETINQPIDSEPVEAETTIPAQIGEEQPEPLHALSATQPSTNATPPQPPVISYAAVAAAADTTPTPSHDQPSAPPEQPSKLGLDLHGESSTTEAELPVEEPLAQSVEEHYAPSVSQVVAPAVKSEQANPDATPEDTTPVTPAPETEAEAAGTQTPASEHADNEPASASAETSGAKSGKPKAKGKNGKGKKKKGKK